MSYGPGKVPAIKFSDNQLMEISKILGDTGEGLTGREIANLLASAGLEDPGSITKRDRLFYALANGQAMTNSGQVVCRVIELAMDPVRYRGDAGGFDNRRIDLNTILLFAGAEIREDGKLVAARPATTLGEAQQRANKLRSELMRRGIAGDVLAFCRPELLDGNYFHAVFEATKSLASKIRAKTGSTLDGSALVEEVFSIKGGRVPLLAWNALQTDNHRSEHRGTALMISGVFAYFRNLPAHVPKVEAPKVTEDQALEVLTMISFLHRRLDLAVPTNPTRNP